MNELTKEKQITVFYPELGKNIDCYHTKVVRLAVEELKNWIKLGKYGTYEDGLHYLSPEQQRKITKKIDDVFSGVKE